MSSFNDGGSHVGKTTVNKSFKNDVKTHSRNFSEPIATFRDRSKSFPETDLERSQLSQESGSLQPSILVDGEEMTHSPKSEIGDFAAESIPVVLQEGTPMTKVSAKKKKVISFRIDADEGSIIWISSKPHIGM